MSTDLSCDIELSPAFHDCDPMQVVWHGNYFKYLEIARCALLRCYDYDYPQMQASGFVWPVVDVRLKYIRPLLYGQNLVVNAKIVEWENRLKIDYAIHDSETRKVLTRGYTIQVAVDGQTNEMQYVCPKVLWDRLGVKPE